jgi:5-methylcytosine-specific restriction enzyme subunit McrC
MKVDSSFSRWPELITYPSGRPTNKRHTYIVAENSDTEVPVKDLLVDGALQVYPSVDDTEFLSVYRKRSTWIFKTGRYIGLIPINDYAMLDVRPRVPVKNLTHIMRIAEGKPRELDTFLSYYSERHEGLPSMLDFFARALADRISDITLDGLHREYVGRSASTSFPRGRIHIGETMRRHTTRGIGYQVAASWYEPTTDTPANRCLKYTLWLLADQYNATKKRNNDLMQRLERSYHLFSGVSLDTSLAFLNCSTVQDPETLPSIRAYYKPALYLALLILQNRGISFTDRKGRILMSSLLINLQTTFEKYARNVLRARLRDFETEVRVLDGNLKGPDGGQKPLFDDPIGPSRDEQTASPDIVFNRTTPNADGSHRTLLVAEIKYKDFVEPRREDIAQAITYAASYRAPVVIIHPRVEAKTHGMSLPKRMYAHTIYHYAFDLAAENPDAEEQVFANSFRSLLGV